jgi:nicotinamide mononucleotide transporter
VINALSSQLAGAWRSASWVEISAAALAVLYVVLAIGERRSCWAAAFVSSCLYVLVLFGARLYMESVLNGFYAVMAVYGYRHWRAGTGETRLAICRWPLSRHAGGLLGVLVLSAASSFYLRRYTPAAWPIADSLVAWSSVFATFLVARKVYENWHWWLIIDATAACLYFARHLYPTSLLFALYLPLIVIGMRQWRLSMRFSADARR